MWGGGGGAIMLVLFRSDKNSGLLLQFMLPIDFNG